jgi:probable rRNA maturation factor
MDPGDSRLRVLVADGHGRRVRANGLATWLRRVAPARARGTVSVALVSDQRIRALNRTYRRKNSATDVLTFSYGAWGPTPTRSRSAAPRRGASRRRLALAAGASRAKGPTISDQPFLGDIVIARGVAKRQARDVGHSEATELRVLALHGLLHLLGYDHERDDGRMRRVEQRLRRKGGLSTGLIERAT